MKKIFLTISVAALLLGFAGCGTEEAKRSETEEPKKTERTVRSSSTETKKTSSIEKTSAESTQQTESSKNDGKLSEAGFKELLSGIEYNKEYLTEDQIAELKETHKADLTEEQYQEFLKVLE